MKWTALHGPSALECSAEMSALNKCYYYYYYYYYCIMIMKAQQPTRKGRGVSLPFMLPKLPILEQKCQQVELIVQNCGNMDEKHQARCRQKWGGYLLKIQFITPILRQKPWILNSFNVSPPYICILHYDQKWKRLRRSWLVQNFILPQSMAVQPKAAAFNV